MGIDPGFYQPGRHTSQPPYVDGAVATTLVDAEMIWHTRADCRYSGCRGTVGSEGSQTSTKT